MVTHTDRLMVLELRLGRPSEINLWGFKWIPEGFPGVRVGRPILQTPKRRSGDSHKSCMLLLTVPQLKCFRHDKDMGLMKILKIVRNALQVYT